MRWMSRHQRCSNRSCSLGTFGPRTTKAIIINLAPSIITTLPFHHCLPFTSAIIITTATAEGRGRLLHSLPSHRPLHRRRRPPPPRLLSLFSSRWVDGFHCLFLRFETSFFMAWQLTHLILLLIFWSTKSPRVKLQMETHFYKVS